MSVLLRIKDVSAMVASHNLGQYTFNSWGDFQPLVYDLVSSNMEPNRSVFWGYRPTDEAYFISDSVSQLCRIAILQTEHHRLRHNLSHLQTIQYALCQPTDRHRDGFIRTLHAFYKEEATSFEEPGAQLDNMARDIIATHRHLQRLVEKM